ncbi:MAG: hypothetical protein NZM11_05615 [Anaerolineales bacterium]|nr:hypothetical protein [Anaerolineales bacterium]
MSANPIEADRALLRRFEPIIRYTRGEQFFPMNVELYVRESSLWVLRPGEDPQCLVPEGELTLEKLAEPRADGFGAVYYLKFIEPLNLVQLAQYLLEHRRKEEKFHPGRGRLARVGYLSRFVAALFSLTLLARGRIPGDTAIGAALVYRRLQSEREHYVYYGRVVRDAYSRWIVLQYWFFYPFNNWRSGFFGVNDHEADWEMASVYLSTTSEGELRPEWVAYASHDLAGDDLRRRWDDPELEKVGEHPVIYAGAGSHASYFQPGEYLTELEIPFLAPLQRVADIGRGLWQRLIGAGRGEAPEINVFRIPFVDYARGDGLSIGPGQARAWDPPELLDPTPGWAREYRGLWGVYVRDPVAGENAPAGPLYNRDGRMRRAWYDPLGWAGLDKLPPPTEELTRIRQRLSELAERRAAQMAALAEKTHELMDLGVEDLAMENRTHLRRRHDAHVRRMATLSREAAELRAQMAEDDALRQALELYAEQLQRGERGDPRAHIRRAHTPAPDSGLRLGVLAETWSAISIGLLLIGFVFIVLFARQYLLIGLAALVSAIVFVEAGFRRQLAQLIPSVTTGLALVCALVLLFEFFWEIVIVSVFVAGSYIMWENWRELRG